MNTQMQKPKAPKQAESAKPNALKRTPLRQGRTVDSILYLQRTIGNQAVQERLKGNGLKHEDGSAIDASAAYIQDTRPEPVCRTHTRIQPKLKLSKPGDRYEQEAERVANLVLTMTDPRFQRHLEIEEKQEPLQAKVIPGSLPDDQPGLESGYSSMQGVGRPLDFTTRGFFESRFGRDLSQVRVNTDGRAANAARVLNAEAFTSGRNIYFGVNRYRPDTLHGKKLLAHELVHVAQQGAAPAQHSAHAVPTVSSDGITLRREVAEESEEDTETSLVLRFLDAVLPVGQGYFLGGNIGITPVIPVFIGEEAQVYLDRRDAGHIHILYRDRGQINLEAAVGAGLSTGGSQRGNVRRGFGAELGAQGQAGLDVVVIQEYLIPIGEFDDYLINEIGYAAMDRFISTFISGGMPGGTTFHEAMALTVRGIASGGQLEPYEIRRQVELGAFLQGNVEASLGLRDVSKRSAAEGYTRTGETRPAGRPSLGLMPEEGETSQDVRTRNKMYILNRLLAPSLRLGASLRLSAGYEQTETESQGAHTSNTKIFFEGEHTLQLPLISALPVISGAGLGASFNIRVRSTPREDRITDFIVKIHTTTGELDYYAGAGSESTLTFNVGNLFSQEEIERLLDGDISVITSGVAERIGQSFEGLQVRWRYQIGGQLMRGFNLFARRHSSARVLISDAKTWRDATVGLDISGYLTVTYSLDGPDTMQVLSLIGSSVAQAGGRAAQTVRSGGGISVVYETLKQFVVDFAAGEQGQALERKLLDGVKVSEATVFFSVGGGLGAQFRLKAGGGIRLGGYVEAGMSCEKNFAEDFGGVITLRTFMERIGEVLADPVSHLPDCHIVQAIMNILAGHRYEAFGGGTEGQPLSAGSRPVQPGDTERVPDGGETGDIGRGSEDGSRQGLPVIEVITEPVAEVPSRLETQPSYEMTLHREEESGAGTYQLEILLRLGGRIYRTPNIPMREVSRGGGTVTVELASESPYRVTPKGTVPELVILPNMPLSFQLSEIR